MSAGIGIYFGIEHQHIDILPHSQHVVEAAKADIVCPAVTTKHPDGFLGQVLFERKDLFGNFVFHTGKHAHNLSRNLFYGFSVVLVFDPLDKQLLLRIRKVSRFTGFLHQIPYAVTHACLSNYKSKTKLGIILEQRVSPRRPFAFFVFGIWG
ncbi:hypothetical protein SDC9_157334 [bioreactor metagenome]|uniref:Uncharacterized protein n=1 Tax=bioreactor metagenome TaxID=1076179 RepID=A0A645F6Y7_9ZZZZ